MSMSEPLSAAQTERYFDEHYSVDDYYTEKQLCVGQWVGQGAAALGLAGEVSREDFSALLQGLDPHSKAVIIPAATHNHEHRAGWDSVFSAPKSVSLQALIDGDSRLIEAHARAVQRALVEIEGYALARYRHGQEDVVTANVVGAAFNHLAARPADDVRLPDPQLHTHVVLLNITRRPDGAWRSLNPIEIFGAQRHGSAIYRSELALEVQRLGYRIQVTKPDGTWELEGYTREQVMAFSQRRQQIEQGLAEAGYHGAKAAQIVALNSRQAKRDYDEAELKADWRKRAIEAGIDTAQHLQQALKHAHHMHVIGTADARESLNFALAHSTDRQAVVDRRELETAALQHGMGKVDLAAVRREITAQEAAQTLIRAGETTPRHPQGAWTTDQMLRLEQENLALVKGPAAPIAQAAEVQRWGAAKQLSAEQINAAKLALSSHHWATIVEGYAGAAKTFTVGAIRQFAEQHGVIVRGFGETTTAVKALRDAGLNAQTVASLLAHPLPAPTGPEIWFVDESSLATTRKTNQMLKIARQSGLARLVYVGDQQQHQGIEAGAPLRQFMAAGVPVAMLADIRRQHDPALREVVRTARDDGREAFDLLQAQGRITQIPEVKERYQRIAADYLAGHQARQNTLVVSPGNDERRALNTTIRELLVERGHVQEHGRRHQILVSRELTPAQIQHAGSYEAGDVIHAIGNRLQQRQGLLKNSYLTVEAVNRRAELLTLRTKDGRHLEVCPYQWERGTAEVFREETRMLAIGDRLQFRHPDHRRHIANAEFAVITATNTAEATIRLEGERPRELTLPFSALRHVDYGYTVTSFSSQGSTVDRVIINDDSMRSARLVNREQLYVSASRGRIDARIYTDDAEAVRLAVARDPKKEIALDAVKQQSARTLEPRQETTELQPQPSTGLRIGI